MGTVNTTYCASLAYTVQYSATDALSGLNQVEAQLNGQAVVPNQTVALPPGDSLLDITAGDQAGIQAHQTVTLTSRYDYDLDTTGWPSGRGPSGCISTMGPILR